MKAPPLLAFLAALCLLSPAAQATTDGGASTHLLTLAGTNGRYAVLSSESVQAGCGETTCEVFHVDLEDGTFRRRAVREITEAPGNQKVSIAEVFYQYLARAPANERVTLGTPHGGATRELAVDPATSKPEAVKFKLPSGGGLRVELEELWTAASLAPYDRLSGRLCLEQDQALCSSCAREVRWVDGEKRTTWACKGRGEWRGAGDTKPCDCSAVARMLRLRMTDEASGRHAFGSKLLVEPFRLAQLWMNGPGEPLDASVGLGVKPDAFHSHVQALLLPRGILVVGSATHTPMLNGTFFPVVGFFPWQ